ncbi:MAG: ParB/RepB/Spo0J family partition protein [Clostridia bacterium]|nr:ParB/RepB/Spo0J family partition protein [Clostridia bacterium]
MAKNRTKLQEGLLWLDVEQIIPAANQPRTVFREEQLKELSASIAAHGVLQPLIVVAEGEHYRLIAGERRLRASKMAGLRQVPCVLTQKSPEEAAKLSLIENLQRENLSFFEEAAAYRRLMEEFDLSQAEIAREMSKDPSTVANKLRLLKLPISAQILINKSGLTERHARALLRVENQDLLMDLLETIIDQALNVKETETMIAAALTPKEKKQRPRRVGSIKDIRLCINTLNHTVATLKQAGIKPQTQIHDEERFVEYIIRIPKTS